MIREVLGWLAILDAIAGLLFAGLIYILARRAGRPITIGHALAVGILLGLPATLMYCAVGLWSRLG